MIGRGILRRLWFASILGVFLGSRATAFADMATQFGLSPRAIGMGNAVSAVTHDYASTYYNPAGLALTPESSFTLGYMYTSPRFRLEEPPGTERLVFTESMNAPVVGYRQNLRTVFPDSWKRNLVVALALAASDNFKTGTLVQTYLYEDTQIPVFGRVQDMLVMNAGVGIEVFPFLLLGAGMRFAATYDATSLIAHMNLGTGAVEVEKLAVNADTEMQPIAGFIVRPWETLNLAGVWRRGGSPIRLVGAGGGSAQIGSLVVPMSLTLAFRDFFTPDEFAASIAWSPWNRLLLALEVTWALWSKYDVPYGENPPGDPFRDIVIPRFGVEYAFTDRFKAQSGYYWQPSPVKDVQPYTHYLDTDQHVFSAAVEYGLPLKKVFKFPLVLRAYFQYQYLPRREILTFRGPGAVWGYIINVGGTVEFRFR
jgi:hypothetical protein